VLAIERSLNCPALSEISSSRPKGNLNCPKRTDPRSVTP
jgi:hypothetical protein